MDYESCRIDILNREVVLSVKKRDMFVRGLDKETGKAIVENNFTVDLGKCKRVAITGLETGVKLAFHRKSDRLARIALVHLFDDGCPFAVYIQKVKGTHRLIARFPSAQAVHEAVAAIQEICRTDPQRNETLH